MPVPPNRENNIRNGFQVPLAITPQIAWDTVSHPHWLFGIWARTLMNHGMPHFENMDAMRGPPVLARNLMRNIGKRDQLAWKHVELIRKRWKGKLVVKGLIAPADARIARESGVDGVIVSNHGGRQLDHTVSSLRTLPEIAAEANGMTVMVDGGIRRGTDVLKALALGAHFVFVGRPFLYAAVIAGEAGVQRALALLKDEVDRDMALLGIRSIGEITSDLVRKLGSHPEHLSRQGRSQIRRIGLEPPPHLELAVGFGGRDDHVLGAAVAAVRIAARSRNPPTSSCR